MCRWVLRARLTSSTLSRMRPQTPMILRYPFVLLAAALVAVSASSHAASPPHGPGSGPTLAVEDTMRTEVSEVLVRAPRVTLDEILDRVARGEARRESLMTDQTFTASMRVVRGVVGAKPEVLIETVSKVYKKKPDKVRTIELRNFELKPDKDAKDRDVEVDFGSGMSEEAVNFAFRPEARREYKYRIESRQLLGDHLIYRIRFEPKSALAVYEPSGLVWVDTKDYVIVRQELQFRQSPVPLFLKGIDRMVIERTRVGEHWVIHRMMLRVRATVPLPKFGRSFDMAVQFADYSINSGLPDSLFVHSKSKKSGGRS